MRSGAVEKLWRSSGIFLAFLDVIVVLESQAVWMLLTVHLVVCFFCTVIRDFASLCLPHLSHVCMMFKIKLSHNTVRLYDSSGKTRILTSK